MCNGKCGYCCCGCVPSKVARILLIVGGLNWGLMGLGMLMGKFDSWNVVRMIFGSMPTLEAIVYILVGIAALMCVFHCRCAKCKAACETCCVETKTETKM